MSKVYLFGEFQVLSDSGADFTAKFHPKIREAFLLVLLHSVEVNGLRKKSINISRFTDLIWPNSSKTCSKNIRSVTLAKVREILSALGDIILCSEDHQYFMEFRNDFYCDYLEYLRIIKYRQRTHEFTDASHLGKFLDVIERGPFLSEHSFPWLDPIQSNINESIIEICELNAKIYDQINDYLGLLRLAATILKYDTADENAIKIKIRALVKLGRGNTAKTKFENFKKEYKRIFDEEYPISFNDILKSKI